MGLYRICMRGRYACGGGHVLTSNGALARTWVASDNYNSLPCSQDESSGSGSCR